MTASPWLILHRQIYHEIKPLELPNVRVWCKNTGVIDALTQMGPKQVPQLRYLTVKHSPVGFKLFSSEGSEPDAAAENGKSHLQHGPDEIGDPDSGRGTLTAPDTFISTLFWVCFLD